MFKKKPENKYTFAKKRQFGAEKRLNPLSNIHTIPSTLKIALSRLAIVTTVGFWLAYIISTILRQLFEGPHSYRFTLETFGYVVVVTVLTFSALMYLVTRTGALVRFSRHRRVPRAELDKHFAKSQKSMTVLVPSYAEETEVIRKTLLSAALQEYPGMRVALLIDDKPNASSKADKVRLDATRKLADEIAELFAEPHKRFSTALKNFEKRAKRKHATKKTVSDLITHYTWAAAGLNTLANKETIEDHVDVFFAEQVLRDLANDLSLVAKALTASLEEGAKLPWDRVHQLHRRLAWIFDAELVVFERKKYASLSKEANKAMNLNSYIGLMGGSYREQQTPDGPILVPVSKAKKGDLVVPDSEYLLTLDADSILLKDYCLRLVYLLEQPENERVAVTQTPYSSFRGAPTRIERLAAATTDIQHILHQGMSYYNATFWVGANAVIRKQAIEDIVEVESEGGFEIKRYIQDWTVIEDTESSIDLAVHGWTLQNYPERLSYSATPPDFGSLIVQRRRWANGGLLILPKLLAVIRERRRKNEYVSRAEIFIRLNYMASIAWASFGLIFLLAYPYDSRLLSPLVLFAALPYFLTQASDLKYSGYKRTDIFRIYGFNLILLPVNLAGVLKSIQQALTSKKIPFARTPKVKNRTVASMYYVIVPMIIIGFSVFTLLRDINAQNWGNALFAGFNALTAGWATLAYVGPLNSIVDIWHGLTGWLRIEVHESSKVITSEKTSSLNWQSVLYHGEDTGAIPYAARAETAADQSEDGIVSNGLNPFSQSHAHATAAHQLSPLRMVLAVFMLTILGVGGVFGQQHLQATRDASNVEPWFAAYVDVTSTPTFAFEQMGTTTATRNAVLSFIVASPEDGCVPTWGGAYTLDEAADSLDLDRRIARLQQQDGSIAISFGGLLNDELALACDDVDQLLAAYEAVIDRYDIDTIDLDLEGKGLTDSAAGKRRAEAVAKLQQNKRATGKSLAVWATIPVTAQGLIEDGTNAVSWLLEGGVDLAGVNAMTMNFGDNRQEDQSMRSAAESALTNVHRQLGILYERAGIQLTDQTLWKKIGATPMIGQNDISTEIFTLEDAHGLNEFGQSQGIGRMSMWSANRDRSCGGNYTDLKVVSDSCSGIEQDKEAFATILSDNFEAQLKSNSSVVTTDESDQTTLKVDDPTTSPYQIWKESGRYLQGTKIVWRQNVYEAKWWTQGSIPDNPVLQTWETAWQLVGPVLPGEKPIEQPTLPEGTYPQWIGTDIYEAGKRVLFDGIPYQAKWWTQGDSPAVASSNADSSAWVPLTQAQIEDLL